jgi:hypothetical protein
MPEHGLDLTRFNAQSFERLIRALCFERFGAAGAAFPPGPDGGRDYALEGRIPGYEAEQWDGYLIVQAKFRDQLRGSESDVRWLLEQLSKEHAKFLALNAGIRAPQYYIIATNVSLSGADGRGARGIVRTGGQTKINQHLQSWKETLGLKGSDIWHPTKLEDLLAGNADIRKTFGAWLTTGDVLKSLEKFFGVQQPNFERIVRFSLKHSIRRDQYAKLRDAGDVRDMDMRTSQVFIDLPFVPQHAPSLKGSVVADIAHRAKEKLDNESVAQGPKRPLRNRIVLLGGPGQGKSTASLFLSQLFRASLISADSSFKRDENLRDLVPEILSRAKQEGVSTQLPARYPVHILLPKFADAISDANENHRGPPSLIAFIVELLSRGSDSKLTVDAFREWLSEHPFLFVLDGLDEVPPSGERQALLDAIDGLLTELADAIADALVVVTTRPQGYNQDLDPNVWEHWRLADLSSEKALSYAAKLARAHYPEDEERREEIARQLKLAATKPATSRLLISPLQVTIMHMIVDTGGGVPAARWTLFNEYFEVLKKREKAKPGPYQRIIERNLSHLGPIHQRVGIVLQTDSERAGAAASALTHDRFRKLLKDYFSEMGTAPDALESRVGELMNVALHRLVLLATREESHISFDVRSLQEYMAAAAITADDADVTEARLLHIANKAHWRHVFLIAASRIFSEDGLHYRRAAIVNIPRGIESDPQDFLVRTGARLAYEMFVDGIALEHPNFRRQLAVHALELLSVPARIDSDLSVVWEPETASVVLDSLQQRIGAGNSASAVHAWLTLLIIAQKSEDALQIAGRLWPKDAEYEWAIVRSISKRLPSAEFVLRARKAILNRPVLEALNDGYQVLSLDMDPITARPNRPSRRALNSKIDHRPLNQLYPVRAIDDLLRPIAILKNESAVDLYARLPLLSAGRPKPGILSNSLKKTSWKLLRDAAVFQADPTPETLALAIESHNGLRSDILRHWISNFYPWPLITLLRSRVESHELALQARAGDFGTTADWLEAERRWIEHGIVGEDIKYTSLKGVLDNQIARIGCPAFGSVIPHRTENMAESLHAIVKVSHLTQCNCSIIPLDDLRESVRFSIWHQRPSNPLSVDDAHLLVRLLRQKDEQSTMPGGLFRAFEEACWNDDQFVKDIAQIRFGFDQSDLTKSGSALNGVVRAFNRDHTKRGLLPTLLGAALTTDQFSANDLADLNAAALSITTDDSPDIAASVIGLRLLTGRDDPDNFEVLKNALVQDRSGFIAYGLASLIQARIGDRNGTLTKAFTEAARQIIATNDSSASFLLDTLRRCLDARQSDLNCRHTWINKLSFRPELFDSLSFSQSEQQQSPFSATR